MNIPCHDCLAEEGKIHEPGCDMERCPKCKGQLISCDCWNDDTDIEKIKNREPYFFKGFSCARCGDFLPKMIMVSVEQWEKVCGSTYKKEDILCPKCMQFIILKRGIKE